MAETFSIRYQFAFAEHAATSFTVHLDRETFDLVRRPVSFPPDWTVLGNQQCGHCPFDVATTPHCPIALNLAGIVEHFQDYFSYQTVVCTVTTEERDYVRETSLQQALSALIGIVMVTSGCPRMARLKPNVRFHLPFATLEETVYRTLSMYLVSRYLLHRRGQSVDFDLKGLEEIYADVGTVNTCFAKRLLQSAKKDANLNALVNLHCFAEMVPLSADEVLDDMAGAFAAFFD